jgi:hypothetical protein
MSNLLKDMIQKGIQCSLSCFLTYLFDLVLSKEYRIENQEDEEKVMKEFANLLEELEEDGECLTELATSIGYARVTEIVAFAQTFTL